MEHNFRRLACNRPRHSTTGQFHYLARSRVPGLQQTPTLYYGPKSGIGLLLLNRPQNDAAGDNHHVRVGVIGLGAGTLAAYGQPGDYMRFYDVNPEVVRLAKGTDSLFTFLRDTPAGTDVVLG